MAEGDWNEVKRLFAGALQQPVDRRDAWLEGACPEASVRAEVQALLISLERAGDFLEGPWVVGRAAEAHDILADCSGRRFAPGDRLARYEIVELLATGGMGEVYRARDTRLDRIVVLKLLPAQTAAHPDWRARLEREARAVSGLNHPHVCALYDIGQHGDVDFLVMEHLDGETLAERLGRGALPIDDVLAYAGQIADALDAAHQTGIVHRDLKPANVVLTAAGAKLLDFGIAKPVPSEPPMALSAPGMHGVGPSAARDVSSLTQQGALVGTAKYMAPEQVRGGPMDGRADLFSLGAVLYEMTTGHKAFAGEDRASVLEAILEGEVPPMRTARRGVPGALERVVRKCLAKAPEARYQSAADVRRDLAAVAASRRRIRRGRWLSATALVVSAALGLAWSLLGGHEPAPSIPPPRIMLAVLPFANQSGDPTQDYLVDGFSDELITELARLEPGRLGVIARTSTVRYRETHPDASRIGRELGVDYFIEGSAARAGGNVRISVRLARARDQTPVWTERYERELDDILIVQADVARSIAREVAVALTPEKQAQLDAREPIDPEAYEHYLRGRYFWNKRTEEGLRRAVAEFEAATREYPGYAAAYAGIADSYLLLAYYAYLPPEQAFGRARAAATTALQLDEWLAEAHASLAGIYDGYDRRWADAEREYVEALRLNPNYATAHQWYANYLIGQGRLVEAQARILRAHELDPLSLIIQVNVANILLLSREYGRAIEECRKALEMEEDFVTARWVLGRAHELSGQYREAIEELERGLALEPESTLLRAALARTYAVSGAPAKARELLRELEGMAARRYVSALDLGSVHAALGQTDEAFAALDRAVSERANLLGYINVDPAYDDLRDDPRFGRILATLGLE